jgi:uncharacterized protein
MSDYEVKPFPNISQALRDSDIASLRGLFEEYPEMIELDVPAFGTWLHKAATQSSVEIIEYLIKRGFDINCKAGNGPETPLSNAATKGRVDIVKYLINNGAHLDTSNSVGNPLFGAIVGRSLECARLLIDAGIDTKASYILEGEVKILSDAVAFAMLRGEREIAHMVALHNANGDESQAQAAMAEGLRIAELRTAA